MGADKLDKKPTDVECKYMDQAELPELCEILPVVDHVPGHNDKTDADEAVLKNHSVFLQCGKRDCIGIGGLIQGLIQ